MTRTKRILLLLFFGLIIVSCKKIPYEQYYVWRNDTDTTLVLEINPPANREHPYLDLDISEIFPPMVTVKLEPHVSYTLHGSMIYDYTDKWYIAWVGVYPTEKIYITGQTKHLNTFSLN